MRVLDVPVRVLAVAVEGPVPEGERQTAAEGRRCTGPVWVPEVRAVGAAAIEIATADRPVARRRERPRAGRRVSGVEVRLVRRGAVEGGRISVRLVIRPPLRLRRIQPRVLRTVRGLPRGPS